MTVSRQYISEALGKIPRCELVITPTPLEDAANLSDILRRRTGKCPRLLIKREDSSGLGGGGEDARQFEYTMAHMSEKKYDTLIVVSDYHSNLASFAAAACARLEYRCIVISVDKLELPITGNLLAANIMGAESYRVSRDYVSASIHKIAEKVRADGGMPYVIKEGKFADCNGAIASFRAGLEIESQVLEREMNGCVTICGPTGQALGGLRLYAKVRGLQWKVLAVSHNPALNDHMEEVMILAPNSAADILGLDASLNMEDIEFVRDFTVGSHEDVIQPNVLEAIHTAASAEAIILDPDYSGKVMAALISEISLGRFSEDETVIFIHSGGMQQIFAFDRKIWAWREGCPPIFGEIIAAGSL